jgi:hypothetical protein
MIERSFRVGAEAGVDGRGLDNGAARRNQPVETVGLGPLTHRAGGWPTGADQGDERQITFRFGQIEAGM